MWASAATASFSIAELARPPSSAWLLGLILRAISYARRATSCGGLSIWPAYSGSPYGELSLRRSATSVSIASTSFKCPQVHPVPCCGDTFAWRVRSRRVHAGADAELALLADVPVLPVGAIPELLGILDVVAGGGGRVRVYHPLTDHARLNGGDGPHRVEDRVVRVQAQHHRGEQRVVERAALIVRRQGAER